MLLAAMFFRYGMETRLNNFVVRYVYIVIQKCILDLRKKNNKVEKYQIQSKSEMVWECLWLYTEVSRCYVIMKGSDQT